MTNNSYENNSFNLVVGVMCLCDTPKKKDFTERKTGTFLPFRIKSGFCNFRDQQNFRFRGTKDFVYPRPNSVQGVVWKKPRWFMLRFLDRCYFRRWLPLGLRPEKIEECVDPDQSLIRVYNKRIQFLTLHAHT